MKQMSKAAQERYISNKKSFINKLNHRLIDFKNRYLQNYVDWTIEKLEIEIGHLKVQPLRKNESQNSRDQQIAIFEARLSRKALITLEVIVEANKGFNLRIEKLAEDLIHFGMASSYFKVEKIRTDFSFLITNQTMEVHARIIYAQGPTNAPHYRFITTKRDK